MKRRFPIPMYEVAINRVALATFRAAVETSIERGGMSATSWRLYRRHIMAPAYGYRTEGRTNTTRIRRQMAHHVERNLAS